MYLVIGRFYDRLDHILHVSGETIPLTDAVELSLVRLKSISTADLLDSATYTSTETKTLKNLHVQEVLDTRTQQYLPLGDAIKAGLFDDQKGAW